MHAQSNQTNHEDCQDCRREKKENQQFIAVYQRMQNLRKNVQKTGCTIKEHTKEMNGIRTLSKSLDFGIRRAMKNQSETQNKTISMIGYQMAASLVQKSARSKIQQDNQYLRRRIGTIRKRKEEENLLNESNAHTLPRISQKYQRQNETFTLIIPPIHLNEHQNNQNIDDNDTDLCSTKFSIFKDTKSKKLNASLYRQKYRNMNLWLYSQENIIQPIAKETIRNTKTLKLKKI